MRQQREAAVTELVDTRFDWAHAFHELGRVLSNQTSISALSGQIGATTPTGADHAASRRVPRSASTVYLGDAGRERPDVHAERLRHEPESVAQTLQRLRLMDGVKEVTLQSSTQPAARGSSATGSAAAVRERPRLRHDDHLRTAPERDRSRCGRDGAKTVAATRPAPRPLRPLDGR